MESIIHSSQPEFIELQYKSMREGEAARATNKMTLIETISDSICSLHYQAAMLQSLTIAVLMEQSEKAANAKEMK